jgi:malonyl-CoA O-methyltransferase
MIINKQLVSSRFDKASNSYEDVANIQKESARILVSNLLQMSPKFCPSSILDLGAGTGYVSDLLLSHFSGSNYTLNDISPYMLEKAKEKFKFDRNISFHLGDLEHAEFKNHGLIVSNLALQWANNLEATLHKFYSKSNIFAFSCLIEGSFKEWEDIFINHNLPSPVKKYPHERDLTDFLTSLGAYKSSFETKNFYIKFPNAYSILKYFKNLGASASNNLISITELKDIIKTHKSDICIMYKVFFCVLERRK